MPELFTGTVDIQTTAGSQITITLNGDNGDVAIGGNGQTGDVSVRDATGTERVRIDGATGTVSTSSGAQVLTISLDGSSGDVVLRGVNVPGQGFSRIRLLASDGDILLGGNGRDGDLALFRAEGDNSTLGQATIHLDGQSGTLITRSAAQVQTISLDGSTGDVILRGVNIPGPGAPRIRLLASEGNISLGGNGRDGDLALFRAEGNNSTLSQATIHLDGQSGTLSTRSAAQVQTISLDGSTGNVILRGVNVPGQGAPRIRVLASEGNIWLGGNGRDGDLVLFPAEGDNSSLDQATIHLDGGAGDIILRNADCAEDFDVAAGEQALEPGTVVRVDEDGRLRPTQGAYDRRVVGVVSGAGGKRPGIVLDRQSSDAFRQTVALMGKVYCQADADASPIQAGDLLAPATAEGYAMKAEWCPEAFGAVIGKALGPLATGRGLIPMLVSLQ